MPKSSFFKVMETSTERNGDILFRIQINSSHKIYQGHFPNNPITPGVVMLDTLKKICESHFQKELQIIEVSNLKFLSLVNPTIENELLFSIRTKVENELFHIKNSTTFPDGRIVLKCNATFVIR